MKLEIFPSDEWKALAQNAHLACFGEIRDPAMNRIDYALMAADDGTPCAYMTCRELDSESVYMQYGGAFPGTKGTIKSLQSYAMFLRFLSEKYKRGTTLIENTNHPMMKFAMKMGLNITGVRYFKENGETKILLEHAIEWRS
jgi:hypothetical protein